MSYDNTQKKRKVAYAFHSKRQNDAQGHRSTHWRGWQPARLGPDLVHNYCRSRPPSEHDREAGYGSPLGVCHRATACALRCELDSTVQGREIAGSYSAPSDIHTIMHAYNDIGHTLLYPQMAAGLHATEMRLTAHNNNPAYLAQPYIIDKGSVATAIISHHVRSLLVIILNLGMHLADKNLGNSYHMAQTFLTTRQQQTAT